MELDIFSDYLPDDEVAPLETTDNELPPESTSYPDPADADATWTTALVNIEDPRQSHNGTLVELSVLNVFYSVVSNTAEVEADSSHTTAATDAVLTSDVGNSIVDESATGIFHSFDDHVDDTVLAVENDDTAAQVSQAPSNLVLDARDQSTPTTPFTLSIPAVNNNHAESTRIISSSFDSILDVSLNMDFEMPPLSRMSTFMRREEPREAWSDDDQYASSADEQAPSEEESSDEGSQGIVEEDDSTIAVGDRSFFQGQYGSDEYEDTVGEVDSNPSTP